MSAFDQTPGGAKKHFCRSDRRAQIGNTEIAFTNSAAYMFVAVALITAFLVGGTARRGLYRAVCSR
jgi:hypothetical protein